MIYPAVHLHSHFTQSQKEEILLAVQATNRSPSFQALLRLCASNAAKFQARFQPLPGEQAEGVVVDADIPQRHVYMALYVGDVHVYSTEPTHFLDNYAAELGLFRFQRSPGSSCYMVVIPPLSARPRDQPHHLHRFNHACLPNCTFAHIFYPHAQVQGIPPPPSLQATLPVLVGTTCRPIPAGDQLTVHYGHQVVGRFLFASRGRLRALPCACAQGPEPCKNKLLVLRPAAHTRTAQRRPCKRTKSRPQSRDAPSVPGCA